MTKKKVDSIIEERFLVYKRKKMGVESINNTESNEPIKDKIDKAFEIIRNESPENIQKYFTMEQTNNVLKSMENNSKDPSNIEEALQILKDTPTNQMFPEQAKIYVEKLMDPNILKGITDLFNIQDIKENAIANTILKNIRDTWGKESQINQALINNDYMKFWILLMRLSRGIQSQNNRWEYRNMFKQLVDKFYAWDSNKSKRENILNWISDIAVWDWTDTAWYSERCHKKLDIDYSEKISMKIKGELVEKTLQEWIQSNTTPLTINGIQYKRTSLKNWWCYQDNSGHNLYKYNDGCLYFDSGTKEIWKNSFLYKNMKWEPVEQTVIVDDKSKDLQIDLNITGIDYNNSMVGKWYEWSVCIKIGKESYTLQIDCDKKCLIPTAWFPLKFDNWTLTIPQNKLDQQITITTTPPRKWNKMINKKGEEAQESDEITCIYACKWGRIASWKFDGEQIQDNISWWAELSTATQENIQASINQLYDSWIMSNPNENLSLNLFAWVDSQKCTDDLKKRLTDPNGDHAKNIKLWENLAKSLPLMKNILQTIEESAKDNQNIPESWDEEELKYQILLMKSRMIKLLTSSTWRKVKRGDWEIINKPFISLLNDLKTKNRLDVSVTWVIGTSSSDWNKKYTPSRQAWFTLWSK